MIKREKTRKNPKKMAARFARRQRGGGSFFSVFQKKFRKILRGYFRQIFLREVFLNSPPPPISVAAF